MAVHVFDELELTLPDEWEVAPNPVPGALLQAYAPSTDGFRSTVTLEVYPRTDDGTGRAPIDEFHEGQLVSLARTMTDALVVDDQPAVVAGYDARSSVVAFRQGWWTVTASVWTVEAPGAAVVVVGLSDTEHVTAERRAFEAMIASMSFVAGAAT